MTGVPRGRHAPPPDVRHAEQRRRLHEAGVALVNADELPLTVEGVSRAAGMSKATFYCHWPNVLAYLPDLYAHAVAQRKPVSAAGFAQWAAIGAGLMPSAAQAGKLVRLLSVGGWKP